MEKKNNYNAFIIKLTGGIFSGLINPKKAWKEGFVKPTGRKFIPQTNVQQGTASDSRNKTFMDLTHLDKALNEKYISFGMCRIYSPLTKRKVKMLALQDTYRLDLDETLCT